MLTVWAIRPVEQGYHDTRLAVTSDGIVAVNTGSDLTRALTGSAEVVESTLDYLLPIPEGAEARLAEAMRYATLGGGKRLRAFLVMQTASLFAVSETCAARVAASIEMLHAYSLVHDDLPDRRAHV